MPKFLNLDPEVFGVDINDSSLKIVKLKKKHKGFSLVSYNEAAIKPDILKGGIIQNQEALAEIIKKACSTVKGKKLATKYAAISLPEEKSFSQVIQMPKMTEKDLKSAVLFEVENYIPLSIDKVYLDFQIINLKETKNNKSDYNHLNLLINVMPKSIVDSYVSCFKKAGITPYILEVESQAVARTLLKTGEDSVPIIFIDFGQSNTSFIIFSGNSIRFTSSMPIYSQQLTEAISSELGISFNKAEELKVEYGLANTAGNKYNISKIIKPILDELVMQIKKYINFYHSHASREYFPSDGKLEKIVLCGGGSNLKELPEFLSLQLNLPVELGNPLLNILLYKKRNSSLIPHRKILSFTTAIGLALRGASNIEFGE